MASFDTVNYSLRPSKAIQRAIVFDGVRAIRNALNISDQVYIGFGSVWFTDFITAHRSLGIDDMVSIEADDIGFRRAEFNAPYACVDVRHGLSSVVLPDLRNDERLGRRPWLVWLDYDSEFTEATASDLRWVVENAPIDSILLTTFNGRDDRYGHPNERADHLRTLFGGIVPDGLSKRALKGDRMVEMLSQLSLDLMTSIALETSRPGGFLPAFKVAYMDTAAMVTVGGVLGSPENAKTALELVSGGEWPCLLPGIVRAPHLTMKEAASMQTLLPRADVMTRQIVQSLGFDLEDHQIQAFQAHYRRYPSFAQVLL